MKDNIFKKNLLENFDESFKNQENNKIKLINQKLNQMWGEIESFYQNPMDFEKENSSLKVNEMKETNIEVFIFI